MTDASSIPEITPTELKAAMDDGRTPHLLDVRESFERDIADLPDVGQQHIPMKKIAEQADDVPRDREVVVYCRSGGRSGQVVQYLRAQGWTDVANLKGGVLGWREEVDPSLRKY